ncbi:hypothetical protein BC940DRAFT_290238 [Gongronella butleri]|nr:hypothetical protein BC940DRAFT_290238 [Gongronella butleri]
MATEVTVVAAQDIDTFSELASKLPAKKRQVLELLKQYQKVLQQCQKRTQRYEWAVSALRCQYERRLQEERMFIERQYDRLENIDIQVRAIDHEVVAVQERLGRMEPDLQAARTYAQQRYDKYQRRKKQLHQHSKIPIVGAIYKRKYARAQAKNKQAEDAVAAHRHDMDAMREKRSALAQKQRQLQSDQQDIRRIIEQHKQRMAAHQDLMHKWQNGILFYQTSKHCLTLDQRVVALQYVLQQQQPRRSLGDINQQQQQKDAKSPTNEREMHAVAHALRQALIDFQQAERHGNQHFALAPITFDCMKCLQQIEQGSPFIDKIKTTDLLCEPCYMGSRTTMIIKKKLGFLGANNKALSSSSSSLLTVSPPSPPSSRQSSFYIDAPPSPPPKDTKLVPVAIN